MNSVIKSVGLMFSCFLSRDKTFCRSINQIASKMSSSNCDAMPFAKVRIEKKSAEFLFVSSYCLISQLKQQQRRRMMMMTNESESDAMYFNLIA